MSKLTTSSGSKKNGAVLSIALGIGWFAVWLTCGALVLQWTLEYQKELFEFLLPAYFIAWIASLYIGRAALAALAKKLLALPPAHKDHHAVSVPCAQVKMIDRLARAYITKEAPNRAQYLIAKENKERQEISSPFVVNVELTDLGSYACSLTIYVSQQDWRQHLEAIRFLKTAQEVYKQSPTKESLLQAVQHEE